VARYVRTEAGAKRYGKPIGSPIGGGAASKLAGKVEGAVGKFSGGSKSKGSTSAKSEPAESRASAKPTPHTHESILAHAATMSDADLAKLHEAIGAQRESRKAKPGPAAKDTPSAPPATAARSATTPKASGKFDADKLKATTSREAANAYLSGASKEDLLDVLGKLGSTTGRRGDSKEKLQREAVEQAVGRRLDSDAITRVGSGRPAPGAGPAASKFAAARKPVTVAMPLKSTSDLSPRMQAKAGQVQADRQLLDQAKAKQDLKPAIGRMSDAELAAAIKRSDNLSGAEQARNYDAYQKVRGALLAEQKSRTALPAAKSTAVSPSQQGSLDERIHQAYLRNKTSSGWLMLDKLRADPALKDVPRAELDQGLRMLNRQPGVNVVPESNRKALTPEHRAAAVNIGNQDRHLISIASSFRPAKGPEPSKPTVAPSAGATSPDLSRIRTAAGIDSPTDSGVSTTIERAQTMLRGGASPSSVAAFLRERANSHELSRQELRGEDTPEINTNKADVRILRRLADAVVQRAAVIPAKPPGRAADRMKR
jgi:hypothetical protein